MSLPLLSDNSERADRRQSAVTPERRGRAWGWLEALGLSLVVPALGFVFRREDPFFLKAAFPPIVFAPVLVALRYGFAHGMASALGLAAFLGLTVSATASSLAEVGGFSLGLVALAMLAGEFRNHWERRLHESAGRARYCEQRLNEFCHEYNILKVSHQRLEQKIASTTSSLREALRNLRLECLQDRVGVSSYVVGNTLLDVFSKFFGVQVASYFPVEGSDVRADPSATLGDAARITNSDPMVRECMVTELLVSLRRTGGEFVEYAEDSSLIACLPIRDVVGQCWGVVAIQEMHFSRYHGKNLELMAILGGYAGDLLNVGLRGPNAKTLEEQDFKFQLARCIETQNEFGLPATLISLILDPGFATTRLLQPTMNHRQGLDVSWVRGAEGGHIMVSILMPLTGHLGADAYLRRVDETVREEFAMSLDDAGVHVRVRPIQENDSLAALGEYLEQLRQFEDVQELIVVDDAVA